MTPTPHSFLPAHPRSQSTGRLLCLTFNGGAEQNSDPDDRTAVFNVSHLFVLGRTEGMNRIIRCVRATKTEDRRRINRTQISGRLSAEGVGEGGPCSSRLIGRIVFRFLPGDCKKLRELPPHMIHSLACFNAVYTLGNTRKVREASDERKYFDGH